MQRNIKLYGGGSISPMVRKVEYALELKGLAYESVDDRVHDKRPELFERHPLGLVPVLEVDGQCVPGSSIACEFLDAIAPHPRLVPVGDQDAALCRWLTTLADTDMWWPVQTMWLARIVRPIDGHPFEDELVPMMEHQKQLLAPLIGHIEQQLSASDSDYVIDSELRLADLALATLFDSAAIAGEELGGWHDGRWPLTVAYADRLLRTHPIDALSTRTRQQIEALW